MCVIPKTKTSIRFFLQPVVTSVSNIYVCVFDEARECHDGTKDVKVLVVRNISRRGENWRGYDESFRTLMRSESEVWALHCINYELWFNVVQQSSPRVTLHTEPPFLNRGTGNRTSRDCWAFNQG